MREVLVLREVEGLTDEEIAAVTGAGADAVRMLLLRALAGLARALGCPPPEAREAYRRWPVEAAPLTAAEAFALATDGSHD